MYERFKSERAGSPTAAAVPSEHPPSAATPIPQSTCRQIEQIKFGASLKRI
jgi:hypothetical protein